LSRKEKEKKKESKRERAGYGEIVGLEKSGFQLDGARKMLHTHRGKGVKDRYVPLPEFTLPCSGAIGRRTATPGLFSRPSAEGNRKRGVSAHTL